MSNINTWYDWIVFECHPIENGSLATSPTNKPRLFLLNRDEFREMVDYFLGFVPWTEKAYEALEVLNMLLRKGCADGAAASLSRECTSALDLPQLEEGYLAKDWSTRPVDTLARLFVPPDAVGGSRGIKSVCVRAVDGVVMLVFSVDTLVFPSGATVEMEYAWHPLVDQGRQAMIDQDEWLLERAIVD